MMLVLKLWLSIVTWWFTFLERPSREQMDSRTGQQATMGDINMQVVSVEQSLQTQVADHLYSLTRRSKS